MNDQTLPSADDERYGTFALIRRLLTEQGIVHWRRYAFAFTLMAVSAGCTALSAYLIGDVINQAYVNHNLAGIFMLGGVTAALFAIKGLATYGHSVMLSQIGNRIVADNQRSVFAKLLNEGLGFFSDRHSTEFIARLSAGAAAATQVINLLITSLGRDLLSLIGLVTVMVVQDPLMSFISFVVAPPAFLGAAQADPPHLRASRAASSTAAPASSRRCRKRCRASASSRPSRSKTPCASASTATSRRSSTRPTRWRASPTAPAR